MDYALKKRITTLNPVRYTPLLSKIRKIRGEAKLPKKIRVIHRVEGYKALATRFFGIRISFIQQNL